MNITQEIPFGRENAVTRDYLIQTLGTTDRHIRAAIEKARNEGCIIINKQDGKGYYQTEDIDEIEAQYRRNKARALSILVQQKHLRTKLKERGIEV